LFPIADCSFRSSFLEAQTKPVLSLGLPEFGRDKRDPNKFPFIEQFEGERAEELMSKDK